MDPMQILMLGGTGVTLAIGVVKSVKKRPKGEMYEEVVVRDAIAMCSVCNAEADEFDESRMRWFCGRHVPAQSRPEQQMQRSATQARRPQPKRVDIHNVETVDDRELRQPVRHRREDYQEEDYYQEEEYGEEEEYYDDDNYEDLLCTHGRDPERCKACYQIEQRRLVQQQRSTQQPVQQRRSSQSQPVRQRSRSVQQQRSTQQPVQQRSRSVQQDEPTRPRRVLENPDMRARVLEIVDRYPDINDTELAQMLGVRRPGSVRAFRYSALDELGLIPDVSPSERRRR